MALLIIIHSVTGRIPPYGDSAPVFYATGLVPSLTFMYISRFMGLSLVTNRAMLAFPVVKTLDVMTGRACLEIISSCITVTVIMLLLWVAGENPWPVDLDRAVEAYLSVIVLAFGVGTLVGIAAMFLPIMITIWQLTLLCLYISSGTMFVASNFPDKYAYILAYNPMLQCVEWMRTAFYDSYSDKLIEPGYVLGLGVCTLLLGLIMERFLRRRMMEG